MIVSAVLAPTLAAAVAIALVAVAAGSGQEAFLQEQKANTRPFRAADLQRALLTSPEPYAGHQRDAAAARCRAAHLRRPSRDSWRCTVRYRSGGVARLRVTLNADGSYYADHIDGAGAIVGSVTPSPGR
jgi:hypothetical protein